MGTLQLQDGAGWNRVDTLAVDKLIVKILLKLLHGGFVLEQIAVFLDTLQIHGIQLMHKALELQHCCIQIVEYVDGHDLVVLDASMMAIAHDEGRFLGLVQPFVGGIELLALLIDFQQGVFHFVAKRGVKCK